MARHVRKGDTVIVTAGNDRGATGQVMRVLPTQDRVVVQGVNVRAKHIKPNQAHPQGGVVRREMAIHISNVSPVVDGKPTRVRFETTDGGAKSRIAVKGGKSLHTLRGETAGKSKPKATADESKPAKKTTRSKTSKKTKKSTKAKAD